MLRKMASDGNVQTGPIDGALAALASQVASLQSTCDALSSAIEAARRTVAILPTSRAAISPPAKDEPLAIGLRDAAKLCGVSERTLWSWAKSDGFPHIRQGGRLLFRRDAIDRWLSAREAGGGGK